MAMATRFDRGLSVVAYSNFFGLFDIGHDEAKLFSRGGVGAISFHLEFVATRQNNILVVGGANKIFTF